MYGSACYRQLLEGHQSDYDYITGLDFPPAKPAGLNGYSVQMSCLPIDDVDTYCTPTGNKSVPVGYDVWLTTTGSFNETWSGGTSMGWNHDNLSYGPHMGQLLHDGFGRYLGTISHPTEAGSIDIKLVSQTACSPFFTGYVGVANGSIRISQTPIGNGGTLQFGSVFFDGTDKFCSGSLHADATSGLPDWFYKMPSSYTVKGGDIDETVAAGPLVLTSNTNPDCFCRNGDFGPLYNTIPEFTAAACDNINNTYYWVEGSCKTPDEELSTIILEPVGYASAGHIIRVGVGGSIGSFCSPRYFYYFSDYSTGISWWGSTVFTLSTDAFWGYDPTDIPAGLRPTTLTLAKV
ncbi:hypothetical protein [Rubinisphaera italica]|uniref:Uncharacterized protein n=1 Tax=Rubinisphaera italica TaxID=2527969 RepID=A0A5C5XPD7_9PLAN|nr:hypothetical protein [Rubinisphaera italica]TWT64253.1 hypothetical protein Pan54_50140 [Rubinisphaera italica]